jgi:myo-inositol 2-dehydrogenase / D-chiro-inositol 1-dehydrogenase
VAATTHNPRASGLVREGFQDPQFVVLRTQTGAVVDVEIFVNARYGYDVRCEVLGADGAISLAPTPLTWTDRALHSRTSYPEDWRPRFAEAYRLQSQAWIDSLAANRPSPLATAEDGLAATAVAAALIESMNDHGACTSVKQP